MQRHAMSEIVNHSRSQALERSVKHYWGRGGVGGGGVGVGGGGGRAWSLYTTRHKCRGYTNKGKNTLGTLKLISDKCVI